MNATMSLEKKAHFPVMLDQILSIITPRYGGTFIDCTFGGGGYSKAILEHSETRVIAFDRDKSAENFSNTLSKKYGSRFTFFNEKFSNLSSHIRQNINNKAIIFDLGFSLSQVKSLDRGFSFESKYPLDMRMGMNKFSAYEVLNTLNKYQISDILKYYGDEKDHKKIASKIIQTRKNKKILNTNDLVTIIKNAKGNKKFVKKNVATKSFQAIRIFVNNEVSELVKGLIEATKLLNPGGLLIVVSFHSLEDKIVKHFFKTYSEKKKNPSRYLPILDKEDTRLFDCPEKKPLNPSRKEILINYPSRSAKLRYGIRNDKKYFFPEELVKKFKNYLDIEKIGLSL